MAQMNDKLVNSDHKEHSFRYTILYNEQRQLKHSLTKNHVLFFPQKSGGKKSYMPVLIELFNTENNWLTLSAVKV